MVFLFTIAVSNMCNLCWGRSILHPKIAAVLNLSTSGNETVFINTGGLWELLLFYASEDQLSAIFNIFEIPLEDGKSIEDNKWIICPAIIEDEIFYHMVRPLNDSVLDWFEEPAIANTFHRIQPKVECDPVQVYVVSNENIPSKIIDNKTPLVNLKNNGIRKFNTFHYNI